MIIHHAAAECDVRVVRKSHQRDKQHTRSLETTARLPRLVSVVVSDVVLLLQLRELLLASCEVRLGSCRLLPCGHVVEHYACARASSETRRDGAKNARRRTDDVTFLQVETIQMLESVLGLCDAAVSSCGDGGQGSKRTSITSSNTTNAVPFVFCSLPIRIWRMLP